jgi:membrane-bound ClpP family serine protease
MITYEAVRPLHKQLQLMGSQEQIDLFLYTRGGEAETSWRIAKLFREYSKKFTVIVPFRAHSGGTQVALGADGIVMTELSELGPVDPTAANEFNPLDPLIKGRRIPFSVEDVNSFLKLAEQRAGLKSETERLQTFSTLANRYEPLALGNVNRVYEEIRVLARDLLSLHMDPTKDGEKMDQIVRALTETYIHEHPITRDEAERIGLKVIRPSTEENKAIIDLYQKYEKDMELSEPLDAETVLGSNPTASMSYDAAMVESYKSSLLYRIEGLLIRQPPTQPQAPTQTGEIALKLKTGKWLAV